MTAKKTDYIIIYSFLCASILSIAVIARMFAVTELKMDEFSGLMVFFVTCLLLGGFYFSFQSILNDCLLPVVERVFRKKHLHIEPELKVAFIAETLQEKPSIPKYGEYKQTAQDKLAQEQALTLERVLAYTGQQLALYMKENQLNQLYEHIRLFQYATEEECQQIQNPVTIDSQIKSIDLMHFGWNIGNAFGKPRLQTATFIKRVFAHTLRDSVISTLERKMSHTESKCKIKLDRKIV
ncbi:mobilization protein [Bacteroides reticulotermitis]|uniref:mobilization protein n=1 Tax=Bacteroides reticulotermitis TaxID=1133319 RepID=UPI003A84162E